MYDSDVLLLSRPTEDQIQRFLARAATSCFTYSEVGGTSGLLPPLYAIDHNRLRLGEGEDCWQRGVAAIKEWKMFELGWVRLHRSSTPLRVGENVAVLAEVGSLYWLNACRIVNIVDENGPLQRFGFAYGTLEDHAESGEERFLVERDRASNEVWYDLLAFSRPNHFLARIGYPLGRRLQKKFAAGSRAAMLKATSA